QRQVYLRGQSFFNQLGLMEGPPTEQDIALVRGTMKCLEPQVQLKNFGWNAGFEENDEAILANYLLKGDKGWTLPEFFQALRATGLEFISMVNWWQWNLLDLFQDVDELPIEIAMGLADKSLEEQLYLFDLLHPVNRLLDLYCGLPQATSDGRSSGESPSEWTEAQWAQATLHLHPLLRTENFRANLVDCIQTLRAFPLRDHLPINEQPITIDSLMATCFLPLMASAQPMQVLIQQWQSVRPIDPVTRAVTSSADALALLIQLFSRLESLGYVLVEPCSP
ncbi:MAG: class I SAM-dependent methyltransferase, partial [Synechococcales bacterium]|nr:class I SAM-dependent methyltransferase [Synechococcales bacterium]